MNNTQLKTITACPVTLNECLDFYNKNYIIPDIKYWEPSEYDMKYKYNTPRKLKKLQKDKQKFDQEIQITYDDKIKRRSNTLNVLKNFEELPTDISSLFYKTTMYRIQDIYDMHEYALKTKEEFQKKYDIGNKQSFLTTTIYTISGTISKSIKIDKDGKYYIEDDTLKYYKTRCPELETLNPEEFIQDYKVFSEAIKNDEAWNVDLQEVVNRNFYQVINKINDIKNDMIHILDGVPESCQREADWGVGGYFNGIICRGEKRVSFKSFIAGGWNIQKRHIRVRMTLLKTNKEKYD